MKTLRMTHDVTLKHFHVPIYLQCHICCCAIPGRQAASVVSLSEICKLLLRNHDFLTMDMQGASQMLFQYICMANGSRRCAWFTLYPHTPSSISGDGSLSCMGENSRGRSGLQHRLYTI